MARWSGKLLVGIALLVLGFQSSWGQDAFFDQLSEKGKEEQVEPTVKISANPDKLTFNVNGDTQSVTLTMVAPENHYAYQPGSQFGLPIIIVPDGNPIPDEVEGEVSPEAVKVENWPRNGVGYEITDIIQPVGKKDDNDTIMEGTFQYQLKIEATNIDEIAKKSGIIRLIVRSQICDKKTHVCLPPSTDKIDFPVIVNGKELTTKTADLGVSPQAIGNLVEAGEYTVNLSISYNKDQTLVDYHGKDVFVTAESAPSFTEWPAEVPLTKQAGLGYQITSVDKNASSKPGRHDYCVTLTVSEPNVIMTNGGILPISVYYQLCCDESGQPLPLTSTSFDLSGVPVQPEKSGFWDLLDKADQDPEKALKPYLGEYMIMIPLLLILGFLAFLTPCVFPLVPLTISYIGKQSGGNAFRGFINSVVYVLGIATIYVLLAVISTQVLGMAAGELGSAWYILIPFILIFTYLGLCMFGFYEFQMPSFLMKAKDKAHSKRGSLGGMFLFGLMAGVVASPCTGPVVIMLLGLFGTAVGTGAEESAIQMVSVGTCQFTFEGGLKEATTLCGPVGNAVSATGGTESISQASLTQLDVIFYLALFTLGLGTPLILLGTFSNLLNYLPKQGPWMMATNYSFGILMALAIFYFFTTLMGGFGVSPSLGAWLAIGYILLIAGNYIGAFLKLGGNFGWGEIPIWRKVSGVVFMLVGAVLLIASSYSWNKGHEGLAQTFLGKDESHKMVAGLTFKDATTGAEVCNMIKEAGQSGKPVLLDFWATWCSNCILFGKKLENEKAFQEAIGEAVVIKINYDKLSKADREVFRVAGLPKFYVTDSKSNLLREFGYDGRDSNVLPTMKEKFDSAREALKK